MNRKLLSILLCLVMVLSMVPMAASADEGHNYLAIGDSITTGNGLAEPDTQGFTYHISNTMGYNVTNAAVDGRTAETLLAQLTTGELDTAIAEADIITITCGGNDLMGALYEAAAIQYNTVNGTSLTGQDVKDVFAGERATPSKMQLAISTMAIIDTFVESDSFLNALASYENNMNGENGVLAYIRALNADAKIVLTTQYNPYKHFGGMFDAVKGGIEAGVAELNAVITGHAETSGYLVADVYTAFNGTEEVLTNAVMNPLELDFHPNAAGHKIIADLIVEVIQENCAHVEQDGYCSVCGKEILPAFAITVTSNKGEEAGVAGAMVETACEGDMVNLVAMPNEGYNFVRWEAVSGEIVFDDPASMFASFTMPAGPVELKAIFLAEGENETEPEPEAVYGDSNGDGRINAKDAALILAYAVDEEANANLIVVNADVSGDGRVNAKDAALILQYCVSDDMQFPAETK